MTQNMKHFRLQTFKGEGSDDESESDDELDQNNPASIKKRHKRELERAERENRENTSALLELRDMEDEMNTLLKLFDAQESMIKTMKTIYTGNGLRDITANGQFYLDEALEWLDEYKQSAKEMVKRVDTVRKDVSWVDPEGLAVLRADMDPSTRRCSRWRNDRLKWTKCAGRACRQNSLRTRICRS